MTALFVTKDFAVKSNLLLERNLIWTRPKHEYCILLKRFFMSHTFCVLVRIAEEAILT